LTRQQAEEFLYREARLLDERQYEAWLALFADDGTYWLPSADDDPLQAPSVLYDTHRVLAQRVHQLVHTARYAQIPPSRTIHLISNVELLDDGAGPEVEVRCNALVVELRAGDRRQAGLGQQRTLAARCAYRLRHDGGWRIASKRVDLIDRDQPQQGLTFLL
jgi:3-phenylpropionate/cinnamic acid dioxygenase small subunit